MKKRLPRHILWLTAPVVLASAVVFIFFGWFAVPHDFLVIRGTSDQVVNRFSAPCESLGGQQNQEGVNPGGFSILSWNAHKGINDDWNDDLHSFAAKADFILLQEAALDRGLEEQLGLLRKEWLLAVAFVYDEKETGVLTAGSISPQTYCSIRGYETLVKIPKIILLSTYPIKGAESKLLVINLHLVNFTITTEAMHRQIKAAVEKIKSHRGPVIVAGDFNTWNGGRELVVRDEMQALGLEAVSFSPDDRVEFFGRPVDRVYFRGLEVTSATTYRVETSDHNPLEVHFRVPPTDRHRRDTAR